MIVTVLAAGGSAAALAQAGGDEEAWDAGAVAALDIPVLQGLCLTGPRDRWDETDAGLSPMDAATQVAIPEFDGRLISVPFSFKETGADGLSRYVGDPERLGPGGRAWRWPSPGSGTRPRSSGGWRWCCRPTRPSTPGSATRSGWTPRPARSGCCGRCARPATTSARSAGDGALPGVEPPDGDALIHAVIAAGGQDPEWLTSQQLSEAVVRIPAAQYRDVVRRAARRSCAQSMQEAWGPPPGELYVDRSHDPDGEIVLAALTAGNVVLLVQPPRGFGENPVAIYHDPRPAAEPPLPGRLPVAGARLRRARGGAPGQARHAGMAAGQEPGPVGPVRARRGARQPAAHLPVPDQRPRRGHPGQAAGARHHRRPPGAADDPGRDLRRPGQARAAAGRARQHRRARPGQAAGRPRADLDADPGLPARPRPRPRRTAARRRVRRLRAARRRLALRGEGRADQGRAARARGGPGRTGAGRPGAGDAAGQADLVRGGGRDAGPAGGARAGRGRQRQPGRGGPGRGDRPRPGRGHGAGRVAAGRGRRRGRGGPRRAA